jgi:ATP-binding cassette subfamily B protein
LFDNLVQTFLPALFFAVGAIIVLGERNIWLGLALFVWVVVFLVVQVLLTRWRHPLRVARVAEDSRLTGAVSDAVGNHMAITFFAGEEREEERVALITDAWRKITLRSWRADSVIQGVQDALALVIEVALMVGAVYLWQEGRITVGDFALIQLYIIGLVGQVWNIGNSLRRVYDAFADASEMVDILERPLAIWTPLALNLSHL